MALLFVLFFIVRAYHYRKAVGEGGSIEYKEPHHKLMAAARNIGGIIMLAAMALYFIRPALIAWASVPLPAWLRWGGLAIGYLSLPLIWWTEASLGLNFNTTLHVRDGHTLVTHGPYQWVRHPMYTGLFMLTISWLLASANLLVGLPGLLGLLFIVINRVNREEGVMIDQFGEQYRSYMQRTGRFLPRI
jgi:protein-S-isoprenylcysteine O-methyltransferase Ste14